jgi:CubicO group peptidase (beta-lactamase class C family)
MRACLLFFFCVIVYNASSQTADRKTDSVFQLVKKFFNAKDAEALYMLGGEKFHKALSKEAFKKISTTQLFPAGAIKESELIERKSGISKYKLVHENVVLQLLMNLDERDKLQLFLFQPYQPPVADKSDKILSSNPLKTKLDSVVDRAAQKFIIKANTVGLAIGVLQNGKMHVYGYGKTKKGNKQLPSTNTLFEIGSITKTFTAALLAWHVNKEKLRFNDPITKYLPDSVKTNKHLQSITLQMLSNHTSGLPRLPDNFFATVSDSLNPYQHYDKNHLFSFLKNYKPVAKPGTEAAYSNLGVALLGTILEIVSGQSFETMVKEIICKPLGMKHTVQYASDTSNVVVTYNSEGNQMPLWDFKAFAPAGALRSTAYDLLLYAQANLKSGTDILSKAFALTHKPTYTKQEKIGLGWFILPLNNKEIITHSGGTYGSSSLISINKQTKTAVVVLSNAAVNADETGDLILTELLK